jgi:hypothetical protein
MSIGLKGNYIRNGPTIFARRTIRRPTGIPLPCRTSSTCLATGKRQESIPGPQCPIHRTGERVPFEHRGLELGCHIRSNLSAANPVVRRVRISFFLLRWLTSCLTFIRSGITHCFCVRAKRLVGNDLGTGSLRNSQGWKHKLACAVPRREKFLRTEQSAAPSA